MFQPWMKVNLFCSAPKLTRSGSSEDSCVVVFCVQTCSCRVEWFADVLRLSTRRTSARVDQVTCPPIDSWGPESIWKVVVQSRCEETQQTHRRKTSPLVLQCRTFFETCQRCFERQFWRKKGVVRDAQG